MLVARISTVIITLRQITAQVNNLLVVAHGELSNNGAKTFDSV